jgi:glycerate dehydrogenase
MKPTIVVLDGRALNPGDLSWEPLAKLGRLEIHPRTPPESIVERAQGADIVLTNKTPLSRETLSQLPGLRYIGVLATGYNVVDTGFAASRGIVVTNVPDYGAPSVAQMVFALLLELTNHVGLHSQRVRQGAWSRNPDWCFWDRPLVELSGLAMGIVGYGAIGKALARVARAFGMKVVATTRRASSDTNDDVEFMELASLLRISDVVTLHCPLTPQTERLIDAQRLGLMKPTCAPQLSERRSIVQSRRPSGTRMA